MTHEQDAVEDTPHVCTFSAEKQPQIEAVEKQSQTVEPPRLYEYDEEDEEVDKCSEPLVKIEIEEGESVAKEYPEVVDFLKALKIQDIEQGRAGPTITMIGGKMIHMDSIEEMTDDEFEEFLEQRNVQAMLDTVAKNVADVVKRLLNKEYD